MLWKNLSTVKMKLIIFLCLLCVALCSVESAPVEGPGRLDDLPFIDMFQPEKKQNVPIKPGEYRKIFLVASSGLYWSLHTFIQDFKGTSLVKCSFYLLQNSRYKTTQPSGLVWTLYRPYVAGGRMGSYGLLLWLWLWLVCVYTMPGCYMKAMWCRAWFFFQFLNENVAFYGLNSNVTNGRVI